MDLITACADPNLFGPWFKNPKSWWSWFTFVKVLFGQELELDEEILYTRCTGRITPPTEQSSEAWLICGRRSGKSFILSLIAIYLATFKDWRPFLAPGERATVVVIACDRKQARTIMRYISALITDIPLINAMVESKSNRPDDMTFHLEGSVTIEIHVPSFRSIRGYSICAALLDEVAFWHREDTARPDVEVLAALRPALASVEGSMLLAASSPYARRGVLFDVHRKFYAKDGNILVWQSDTRTMNPTIKQRVVDEAEERDPEAAQSEWHALFRSDLESYVSREAVMACIEGGMLERPRFYGNHYQGFCDPSGGRNDAMSMAIGHREHDAAVVDVLRERKPPFNPDDVVAEFSETYKNYGVTTIRGDRYGGEWPTASFRKHGIHYRPAERPKSDLYRELLPILNSRRIVLPDHPKLVAQLVALERRTGRGGKDVVDHSPGMFDDLSNAVAGLAGLLSKPKQQARVMRLLGV